MQPGVSNATASIVRLDKTASTRTWNSVFDGLAVFITSVAKSRASAYLSSGRVVNNTVFIKDLNSALAAKITGGIKIGDAIKDSDGNLMEIVWLSKIKSPFGGTMYELDVEQRDI